jgi:hypothetical protein
MSWVDPPDDASPEQLVAWAAGDKERLEVALAVELKSDEPRDDYIVALEGALAPMWKAA